MQCVMCGRYTPEGRQACKRCEGGDKIDDRDTRQTTKPKRHHSSCQTRQRKIPAIRHHERAVHK